MWALLVTTNYTNKFFIEKFVMRVGKVHPHFLTIQVEDGGIKNISLRGILERYIVSYWLVLN